MAGNRPTEHLLLIGNQVQQPEEFGEHLDLEADLALVGFHTLNCHPRTQDDVLLEARLRHQGARRPQSLKLQSPYWQPECVMRYHVANVINSALNHALSPVASCTASHVCALLYPKKTLWSNMIARQWHLSWMMILNKSLPTAILFCSQCMHTFMRCLLYFASTYTARAHYSSSPSIPIFWPSGSISGPLSRLFEPHAQRTASLAFWFKWKNEWELNAI